MSEVYCHKCKLLKLPHEFGYSICNGCYVELQKQIEELEKELNRYVSMEVALDFSMKEERKREQENQRLKSENQRLKQWREYQKKPKEE